MTHDNAPDIRNQATEADEAGSRPADQNGMRHSSGHGEYRRFAMMIAASMIAMSAITYLNTYEWSHLRYSETRLYMTLLMGSAMAVIMLVFMLRMFKRRSVNAGIIVLSIAVFVAALWLVRSQIAVDDTSYMRAMIPHHSIAILTSNRAQIDDVRVRELAGEIITSQEREIKEMNWLIDDIKQNGVADTEAAAAERPLPEFSGSE